MTIQDLNYNNYDDFVEHLNLTHGPVPAAYGSKINNRANDGLFIHHVREDVIENLSNARVAKKSPPEYQQPSNLVYCDFLEHLFLHILIGEKTLETTRMGMRGAFFRLIPDLYNFFHFGHISNKRINKHYYEVVSQGGEIFDNLLRRFDSLCQDIDTIFEHNLILYKQVKHMLDTSGRALMILGQGLGKSTTTLHYIRSCRGRALVIVPNNTVKSYWMNHYRFCDTITYSEFSTTYSSIQYNMYELVVLDEAHHIGADEDKQLGALTWSKGVDFILNTGIKILGLTATPDRYDGINIAKTIFQGCVCEGMALETAITENIIHPFSYITAIYDKEKIRKELKTCTDQVLYGQLDLALNNTPEVTTILTSNMPKGDRKGIIFVQSLEDEAEAISIIHSAYPNIETRVLSSKLSDTYNNANRTWFQNTSSGFLISVNMISEGAHYDGVNTVIMFRRTDSYTIYAQQLGRIVTLASKENPNAIVFDLVNNVNNLMSRPDIFEDPDNHSISKIVDAIRKQAEKSDQVIISDFSIDIVNAIREIKAYRTRSWEEWEDEIIRDYYATEGTKGCQRRIDAAYDEWRKLSQTKLESN